MINNNVKKGVAALLLTTALSAASPAYATTRSACSLQCLQNGDEIMVTAAYGTVGVATHYGAPGTCDKLVVTDASAINNGTAAVNNPNLYNMYQGYCDATPVTAKLYPLATNCSVACVPSGSMWNLILQPSGLTTQ